jgi:hypothetical protein
MQLQLRTFAAVRLLVCSRCLLYQTNRAEHGLMMTWLLQEADAQLPQQFKSLGSTSTSSNGVD